MTTPTDAQILAALDALGWPDDREHSAHIEPDGYEVTPARHYWDLVTSVLDAAAAAFVPSLLPDGMTEAELIERFRQAMDQPQRITVLPPTPSLDDLTLRYSREDLDEAHAQGVAEGRCQATEGWKRQWQGQITRLHDGHVNTWGPTNQGDVDQATIRHLVSNYSSDPGYLVELRSRLVGPWEAAAQGDGGPR